MAETAKEKECNALTTQKPAEIMPRTSDMERWFDLMVEDFLRRPFPTLLRPERWWPAETGMMMRLPAVDIYEEKDESSSRRRSRASRREKKREEEVKEDDDYRCERSFGAYTRAVTLLCDVKADQGNASCKNGVLEVRMPKTEEAKKKVITVKID